MKEQKNGCWEITRHSHMLFGNNRNWYNLYIRLSCFSVNCFTSHCQYFFSDKKTKATIDEVTHPRTVLIRILDSKEQKSKSN